MLASISINAQLTSTENYIQSRSYLEPVTSTSTTAKQIQIVQYFDGLGRPKQVVNVKASPLGRDIVNHMEYDGFGRQVKDYLPIPQAATQNGGLYSNPLSNATQPDIYGAEKIYAENKLENSPLDRVQQQINAGNDWSNKPIKINYDTNTDGEVRKYFTTTTWVENRTSSSLQVGVTNSSNGFFIAQQLYKNSITDEDGNVTLEFKNQEGQTLLKRQVLSPTENADTYYVYNEYNQVAFVIPPKASESIKNLSPGTEVSNEVRNEFCYQYSYDKRLRLVERKLPNKGLEYFVYDRQERIVATQDANLREKGQWQYSKYDQFGRIAIMGISTGGSRIAEQGIADGLENNNVNRLSTVAFERQGVQVYYGNQDNTYPNSTRWVTLLSLNYYDTYPEYSFNPTFPTSILSQASLTDNSTLGISTNNLPVMSLVKNLEDDNWTKNYSYYDKKGRILGTHSINHFGGYTKTEAELDFSGKPLQTNTYHLRKLAEVGITIKERFVYDQQNRLKEHYHKVNDKPEQLLAENTYNELSQLTNKKVGNNLQSIDYAYNIRGWLTGINKDQMAVPDLGGKLFSYKIKYTKKDGITNPDQALFPGKDVKAKYNGNVAEVDWRAIESLGANPSLTPKRYGYAYDSLNRLTAGYYQNPNNPSSKEHTESIDYDLNGNIQKLYRTAAAINTIPNVIDNLVYTYSSGNQVSKITDNGNSAGYEGAGGEIKYDLNGNMWKMADKNISKIQYNHLNLPNKLEYGDIGIFGISQYTYRADGIKLQKAEMRSECGIINCYSVTDLSDYLDGFQYMSSVINNNGGGGDTELSRSFSAEASKAMEMQAFSLEERKAIPKTAGLVFFPTAEGFYDYLKDQYIYQYKDHLGNNRISFTRNSAGTLEITDANDYYPFGMNHLNTGGAFFGQNTYKNYKYNGKELQGSGMYDYGARFYMSDIARWSVIDPLAEKFYSTSSYAYVANNPLSSIDPDGRDIINITGGVRFTGGDARSMFRSLQNMTASGTWADIKAFHFVKETVTPNIYKHTLNSFRRGKPELLHYDSDRKNNARRRQQATSGIPTMPGYQRDEYPYASTFEGGKQPDGSKAHVMLVPTAENNWQGVRELRPLYRALKTGDAFLVVPVPKNREPEDVKEEALEKYRTPAPAPVVTAPDFGRPVVPYKMWPVVMGAAVVAGLIIYSRYIPIVP